MSVVSRPKTVITYFSPTSISGCQLWLDAADSSTITYGTGSNVASWKDKINNYAVANSTAAYQPVYSQGSIRFNGITSPSYLDIPTLTIGSSAFSIFIVIKNTGPASGNASAPHFFWPLSGNGSGALSMNGWIATNIQGLNTNISYALSKNQYYVLSYTFGVTSNFEELYANGTSIGTYQKGSAYVASLYRLGTIDSGQSTLSFDGNIGEILVFSTSLGITNRQNVEGYLAQKWGLTSSLPAGHPGLTQTFYGITTSTVFTPVILIPYNLYTNYNPLTATGSTCILWLDASDPSTLYSDAAGTTLASVNGTVGYWRDKSSSGFNCTQTTLAYRPTYVAAAKNSRSILSFNGLTNFLNMPQFTAVPLTIFFVAQGTVFLQNTFFLSLGSAGDSIMMRMLNSPQFYGVDGNEINKIYSIATTNADTNWHLWTLTVSSTTLTFYFDGTLVGTSSWSNGSGYTFATNTIASWNQQVGSKATTLRIPEILFYSAVLGTTQQQQVESYLNEKWALRIQPTRTIATIRSVPKFVSVIATGGTITYATVSGIEYKIHSFTTVGTANFTLTSPGSVITTVLVVAGGGAGGTDDGGGGGAGGVIYNPAFTITSGSYTVTVGNGGSSNGANGANSVLSSLTAIGGGGGANSNGNGQNGGSGGGIGWNVNTPGSGTAGQGFAGGGGTSSPNFCAGGGGGAGGVGGTGSGITPGNGGIGVSYTIAGTTYNVGGGGGGGLAVQNSSGTNSTASFGGGNGAGHGANAAAAGTPNTGGGGGGANNEQATNGGVGGSGIVIISYRWK